MKSILTIVCIMIILIFIGSCASNTATTQQQKNQTDWGTVNTIESETAR
jgi:PBP1b-binding outer membrane lipoprotein LpoB